MSRIYNLAMGRALIVTLLVGCNTVFGIDERAPSSKPGIGAAGGSSSTAGPDGGAGGTGGGEGGTATAGGAIGGGGMGPCLPDPDPCGGVGQLLDEFDDDVVAPPLYCTPNGSTIDETGGALVMTVPGAADCGTDRYYDFVDAAVTLGVAELSPPSSDVREYLRLRHVTGRSISLRKNMGSFEALLDDMVVASAPYDQSIVAWRLREACGQTYWESASDGPSFTTLHRADTASLFDMNHMRVSFGVDAAQGVTAGNVRFERLAGAPDTVACAASTFSDDFDDNTLSNDWRVATQIDCGVDESDARILLSMGASSGARCHLVSSYGYDLRGDAISARMVLHPPNTEPQDSYFMAQSRPGYGAVMRYQFGVLFIGRVDDGTFSFLSGAAYDGATHIYWRIREDSGTTHFETSADGTSYVTLHAVANMFDMSEMDILMGSDVFANLASGWPVEVDDVNR